MKHIVALSGGKDSTAMALRLAEAESRDYEYVCTPTGNELEPMVEHWNRLETLLGRPITRVSKGRTLAGLILQWNALPNWRQRWCTRVLKIEPFQEYLLDNLPCTTYVGIRADEAADRKGVAHASLAKGIEERYPLVEWGWAISDVLRYLEKRCITIPARTDCAWCFFQTLGEWYALWNDFPAIYGLGEIMEEKTGHTFRSPHRDTWPASLKKMREWFEAGKAPKSKVGVEARPTMCSVCAR